MTDDALEQRHADLDRREAELLHLLQRCIPPVDQHRHELHLLRAERESIHQRHA